MPDADSEHIEISEEDARQAGRGAHVFVIWAISTLAAALLLFALYALSPLLSRLQLNA